MEVKVTKTYNVKLCNDCPYFNEHIDYSVCFDTFDEPNFDFYCKHPEADNSKYDVAKYNDYHGKFIGGSYSSFQKDTKIPEWCPCSKK